MKYLSICLLFLLNSEIMSLIALLIIACMFIGDIFMTASKEGKFF